MINAHWENHSYDLPKLEKGIRWFRKVDTGLNTPNDITETGNEVDIEPQCHYIVNQRSTVILIAKDDSEQ
jgi:glycogen operon protein